MDIDDKVPIEGYENQPTKASQQKLMQKQNVESTATAFSKGKGQSMVGAGPKGGRSQAEGTE